MSENPEDEGVRVTDKRRIDPETFEVRETHHSGGSADPLAAEDAAAAVVEGDVAEVEAKVAELTSDLQRVHAEYANYRKRVERDREVIRDMAIGNVLSDLLPVLDDIKRAREHGELEGAFRAVGEALEGVTTKLGLESYGESGQPFDPMEYEALTTESNPEITEPTVVSVFQPGYRFAGRVLRPARVSVAGTD